MPVLTHARTQVALYLLIFYKKGINSIEGTGNYIVSLGQHAGLRTPVQQLQLQLHSCSLPMRHGRPSAACFPSAACHIAVDSRHLQRCIRQRQTLKQHCLLPSGL